MGNWKKNYSSEHLEAADLPEGRQVNVKIVAVGAVDLEGDKGTKQKKGLITFEPSPGFGQVCRKRTWVAAKTCGYQLAKMFGADDQAWVGKWVTLYAAQVNGEEALRIAGSPDIKSPCHVYVREFGGGKRKWEMVPTTPVTPQQAEAQQQGAA
jgi:hypothetical protein